MKGLKQNPFWIGIVLAGVALVAIFAALVFPLWGKQADLRQKNSSLLGKLKVAQVPGHPDMKKWQDYRAEVIESYKKIGAFYGQSDKHLERWFEGLAEDPPHGEFMLKYNDEREKIEKAVAEKNTKIGLVDETEDAKKRGFNWERPVPEDFDKLNAEERKRLIRDLQKRYWARQAVANVILSGSAKVSRVHDFRFFRRLSDKLPSAAWELPIQPGPNAVHYPGATEGGSGRLGAGFAEFDLPNELGKTITFGVALELPYSEVPKVIGELLNAGAVGGGERLLVNVMGAHVTLREQNKPVEEIPYPRTDRKALEEKLAEKKKTLQPKDVLLAVTCQIVDFEPAKMKAQPAP